MYQRLVGKLIYVFHTWPDIAYTMSVIGQFLHNSKEVYLQASNELSLGILEKEILRKQNGGLVIEAYTFIDYVESVVDRNSTSRCCTILGENLITWGSKK